jgi:hypothetical protein
MPPLYVHASSDCPDSRFDGDLDHSRIGIGVDGGDHLETRAPSLGLQATRCRVTCDEHPDNKHHKRESQDAGNRANETPCQRQRFVVRFDAPRVATGS